MFLYWVVLGWPKSLLVHNILGENPNKHLSQPNRKENNWSNFPFKWQKLRMKQEAIHLMAQWPPWLTVHRSLNEESALSIYLSLYRINHVQFVYKVWSFLRSWFYRTGFTWRNLCLWSPWKKTVGFVCNLHHSSVGLIKSVLWGDALSVVVVSWGFDQIHASHFCLFICLTLQGVI